MKHYAQPFGQTRKMIELMRNSLLYPSTYIKIYKNFGPSLNFFLKTLIHPWEIFPSKLKCSNHSKKFSLNNQII